MLMKIQNFKINDLHEFCLNNIGNIKINVATYIFNNG
jgi:hypothetical protein